MATFKVYKLQFSSPLHISNQHEDDDVSQKTILSDTMYAALTSCLAKIGKTIPEDGDLDFTISSLFPYYQRDEESRPIYFLPMPFQAKQAEVDITIAKKAKKVKWADALLYEEILAGNDISDYASDIQEAYLTKESLREAVDGSKEFVRSEVSQRVTLKSRTGEEDAKPYYVDKIIFKDCSGLYFIAEGDTDKLEEALRLLSLEGIGTDRNVGYGFFSYSSDEISIELPQNADHQMALSLLIPESEDQLKQLMDSEKVAYDVVRRGGWITTHPYNTLRKNVIYGFLPGSVFRKMADKDCQPIGKIVNLQPEIGDLTPNHPIWRCGKSIMLPIKLK